GGQQLGVVAAWYEGMSQTAEIEVADLLRAGPEAWQPGPLPRASNF
ncbi:hypothetical protein A2U01_0053566, partial [Trifolium medium]|nr:hypothetical protein [Trifolium medium]